MRPEITAADELPFHQSVEVLDVPVTSDPHFNDGYFWAAFAEDVYVAASLRRHPNTNVLDGFFSVVHDGQQRNLRLSRALRPDSTRMRVGPLEASTIDPLHRQRVVFADEELGVAAELDFVTVGRPFLETPRPVHRHGVLISDVRRYVIVCAVSGSLVVDGHSYDVGDWTGLRDHSWGVRRSMGPQVRVRGATRPVEPRPAFRLWITFRLTDCSGFFQLHETVDGRVLDVEGRVDLAGGVCVAVVGLRHDLRRSPRSRCFAGGVVALSTDTGDEIELDLAPVAPPASGQGMGYVGGWFDGGDLGRDRGIDHRELDRFPVGDHDPPQGPVHVPEAKRSPGTEFACRVVTADGRRGEANVEWVVYDRAHRYGSES